MSTYSSWRVAGTYYEVCNCEAVCPCRRRGAWMGGRSSYGFCDFALSWAILDGHADGLDVSNLSVVLAGAYSDDEPGEPWRVVIYIDERANEAQKQALTDIFLGRAGGDTSKNFAYSIAEVYAIRSAKIELEHTRDQERMDVIGYVSAATAEIDPGEEAVTCGIPGHHQAGQEIVADHFWVKDENLKWSVDGRCGFATNFDYRS